MEGKHIVIGITGSIAAYKAASLVRLFVKAGAEVRVIMTPAAKEFISPLTLATLSQAPVISEFFDKADGQWHSHVDLGLWADAFIIAPASASTIAKCSYGVADNMLITSYLSTRAKVYIAPAMDLDMFAHPTTQENLRRLQERGCVIISPQEGFLASKLIGKGRMEEPEEIFRQVSEDLSEKKRLSGKKILITSGPTHEKIDPVRFIGNYSSGKMGTALAQALHRLGAEVIFVTGPATVMPSEAEVAKLIKVTSALEMEAEVRSNFDSETDAAIFCAAVADYRVASPEGDKVKREKKEIWNLELIANPDIAAGVGATKQPHQKLIGFALETEEGTSYALDKMKRKNLDAIILNSMANEGAGFGVDTNKVSVIEADGKRHDLPLMSKSDVAKEIVRILF
ncbi:MAG: bifunctional phosphopantothenoylcysteine decarboxylase/phosphopantothenate--cysteine ligase CoaBC [Porphyromonas sp.]|nr:bifunctional phosphopantothenoylcysteine decarboxylase/phosphopantothenate--cysteine ligase CoaBC [Porphyromonas sp.]